ncbi:MAG: carboxypeptidase regulatory-like domain-containing protein [Candidatus Synoicihabitans palmerolidicus]|nr:carboxypeptidase regulatory-like domain-containing protein [Candidatus Synoicihabitans palmerolidicus]
MSRIPRNYRARFLLTWFTGALVALGLVSSLHAQSATGSIAGRLIDEASGFGISWTTVTVQSTGQSATTDLSGSYSLSGVPVGLQLLLVVKEGYQSASITDVRVKAGETFRLDIPLAPVGGDVIKMDAFSVSADIVQSSDIGLMVARQKAASISDAIGSDQFGRLGASNAAEALGKVTGASVVDGKYVLIRGLGDRYSNTLMNGVSVPSADPDKRAVQMDQFPTDLIDSVVTTKSCTSDQPGAFSGGSVNLKTKSFPESFFVSASVSVGAKANARGEEILTSPGNTGAVPVVPDVIPNRDLAELRTEWVGDFGPANEIDAATRAFGPAGLFPVQRVGDFDLGFSIAAGNRITYGDNGLIGITGSFNYDRSFDHYDGGETGRYAGTAANPVNWYLLTADASILTFDPADAPALTPAFGVTSSSITESMGGIGETRYPAHD